MVDFSKVSRAHFEAFSKSNRIPELVSKKQEIISAVSEIHNTSPQTVLFMGFSTFVFANYGNAKLYITEVDQEIYDAIVKSGVSITHIPREKLHAHYKKFQMVFAPDEFFTFAESESEQNSLVAEVCSLASEFVITTLRDYKNQEHKDREFSMPSWSKNQKDSAIFLESHIPDQTDRNAWTSHVHQINCPSNALVTHGPFPRRAMYFKQLAKFTADNGSTHFLVHKNLMYKGLVKRNYEHVISISFD